MKARPSASADEIFREHSSSQCEAVSLFCRVGANGENILPASRAVIVEEEVLGEIRSVPMSLWSLNFQQPPPDSDPG